MVRGLKQSVNLETNAVTREEYFLDGKRHRDEDDGPAVILRDSANEIVGLEYWCRGHRHRSNGPARISKFDNGILASEEYFNHGSLHRKEGPALIARNYTGHIRQEIYFLNGLVHRDPKEGPAIRNLLVDETGRMVIDEDYVLFGSPHRDPKDGPCLTVRAADTGKLLAEEYWCSEDGVPEKPRKRRSLKKTALAAPEG